jgi:ubiquinone/menaquinone biosynthesis C-methylase UbiE
MKKVNIDFNEYYELQKNEAGTLEGGWADQMVDAFRVFLEKKDKNSKILDIGCAYGVGILAMNKLGYTNIVGVDLISEKLDHAIKNNLNVRQMDMHSLQFVDNEFDYSFMSHVIEHSIDPVKVVCEMVRVTKKMGFIIAPIEEPGSESCDITPHTSPFRTEDDWLNVLKQVEKISNISFNTKKLFRMGEEVWTTFSKKA